MVNIYLLKDPNTLEIKYVGQTKFNLAQRLVGHLHESYFRKREQAIFKNEWVVSLLEKGQIPIIELIEEVVDELANTQEQKWVAFYEKDNTLFNVMFSTVNFIHREDLHKKVYQYALDGNFIKEWNSLYEVEKTLKIPCGNIIQSCKGKRKLGGKFSWRYYKVDAINGYERNVARKPVYSYDFLGNFVQEYTSAKEAEQYGFSSRNISQCCLGEKRSHKGLQWKFDKLSCITPYSGKISYKTNKYIESQDIVRSS